jgi:hypothetical protein
MLLAEKPEIKSIWDSLWNQIQKGNKHKDEKLKLFFITH